MTDEIRETIYCSKDGAAMYVIDTCGTQENGVRRRRKCPQCGERLTTYETVRDLEARHKRNEEIKSLVKRLVELVRVDAD